MRFRAPTVSGSTLVEPQVAGTDDLALTHNVKFQSRANFQHYLYRKNDKKQMPGATHGGFYNISLNLPQPGVVPVQVDVAIPGKGFFVLDHRRVAVYENISKRDEPGRYKKMLGKSVPEAKKVVWVFGCVAIPDGKGGFKPDPNRRGWVPKAALENKPPDS